MAHRPVEDLRVDLVSSPRAMVRSDASQASRGDLQSWIDRSSLPPATLLLGGSGLALVGLGLGLALPLTMGLATLFGGMVTFGGGIAFLGGLKRKREQSEAAMKALPPAPSASPVVLAERTRRVRDLLHERPRSTFEQIAAGLRWTESALVETLVHMKNGGVLDEDLDLDSGQWVYRMFDATEMGTAASLMLDERMRS